MIAFTNHALDHMLSSVLDAGITKKIVRLGSRSADERISKFNLENLEMVQEESRLDKTLSSQYRVLKETQKEMDELMSAVRTVTVSGRDVDEFIEIQFPDQRASLHAPPHWVNALFGEQRSDGWRTVGKLSADDSLYSFWERGNDLRFLINWEASATSSPQIRTTANRFALLNVNDAGTQELSEDEDEDEYAALPADIRLNVDPASSWMQDWLDADENSMVMTNQDVEATTQEPPEDPLPVDLAESYDPYLAKYDLTVRPKIPTTDRPLFYLLGHGIDMWELSGRERSRLSQYWKDESSSFHEKGQLDQFSRLRKKYEDARVRYNEVKEQVCLFALASRTLLLINATVESTPAERHRHRGMHNYW
jgi:hypothetical protein